MSADKLVDKALERIGNVHPVIAQGAEEIIRRAYKQGLYVLFSDGYRSHAEQDKLYAQGRTASGSIVTNARGGQSLHNYGLALDMFITNEDGTSAEWHYSGLKKAADIAKKIGFEWGGDWKSFKDYPHIQMTGGLSLAQLQAGQKPNISLKGGSASASAQNDPTVKPEPEPTKVSGTIADIQRTANSRYGLSIAVDNLKGPATEKALIIALQTELNKQFKAGLKVDGIWGPKTAAAIINVRKGARGNLTWVLQALLYIKGYNIDVDGIFGNATDEAVRSLQRAYKLSVDGIAGKATWRKLI